MTSSRFVISLVALGALAVVPPGSAAQQVPVDDVVMLGHAYGTRPPQAYFDMKARDPEAFTISRGWKARNPSLRRTGATTLDGTPRFEVVGSSGAARDFDGAAVLGPRDGPVEGTIRVPLVLGLFADSPELPPFSSEQIQQEFFDGPNGRLGTITEYYDEISMGMLELLGETMEWKRASLTEGQVAGGESGLSSGSSRTGEYIVQLLSQNAGVDWGRYDNDGPDGLPNSGDDDGFVDILAVMHPNFGAECGGSGQDDRMWSHKWQISGWMQQPYTTTTDAAIGGKIRIQDYTIQPLFSCDEESINEIGVLAHELGHGLGLPDLYDTSGRHRGLGGWGLMGSGSWGCSQGAPERPCHMSAWSKAQLGWVEVVTLGADADLGTLTFPPVETSGRVFRIDPVIGGDEYYLLENRQAIGFDDDLPQTGLLVWHIDESAVLARWPANSVNASARMGVFLVQADGDNDLGSVTGGNRGDPGDPYPGSHVNRFFHAGSAPAAATWDGDVTGVTLADIRKAGTDVTARVLTRFQTVSLATSGAGEGAIGFAVDGVGVSAPSDVSAAPFQVLDIEAGAGGEISDGLRVGFLGWDDDDGLGRTREFVTPMEDVLLTATYGGEEVRARFTVDGEQHGVPPGTVEMTPEARDEDGDLWFPRGTLVTFQAHPATGYGFSGWTGVLAGMPNPATFQVDDPVDMGVAFELTYAVTEASHAFEAAQEQELVLVAENGTAPITWVPTGGSLPRGMSLQSNGRIVGAALETGTFTFDLRARDANGLLATGSIELEVTEPVLGIDALAAPFLLTSGSLTSLEQDFLDAQGNDNGLYDLGDFRAWVLVHPDLPATVEQRALVRTLIPMFRFEPGGGR